MLASSLCRSLVTALLVGFASTVVRAEPSPQPPVAGPVFPGVSDATVQSLPVAAPGWVGPFSLQVVINGAAVDLVLEPVTLRAPGFVVKVDDETGLHEVAAPAELNFAGSALGMPGSAARFSVVNGSWRGVIDLGDHGTLWWVQPMRDAVGGVAGAAAAEQHAVYSGDAVIADGHGCPGGVETGADGSAVSHAKGGPVSCARIAEIAFDADVLFYQQNGSNVATTNADIDSVLNAMNLIYARDIQLSFTVTTHIVRTTAGLYTSTSPSTLLTQMATEWQANQSAVVRDVAHLMTGQPTGTTIGLAYTGAVCSTQFGYGLSQSRYSGVFSNRVSLTCHEVGHNFNASHCDADADCAIMCSVNGQCAHNTGAFSTRSINEMRPYMFGLGCLASSSGFGTPVAPHATADTAIGAPGGFVDIDVLANDYDGNCQALSIQSFPASTAKGALTRQVGAGPGGRDLIRYSAFAASTGTDTWSYTLADSSAATSTGSVTVTIPAPKAPDYAGPTRTQLDGNYYRLQGQASVPDYTNLFNFQTFTHTGHNFSFPASAAAFQNGAPTDNFVTATTATLVVPTAGSWTFFTTSDEGSLLYIDGALVVNNDFVHTSVERSGAVTLTAGNHAIRVEQFELTGLAEITARWQGPGVAKAVIPPTALSGQQIVMKYYNPPAAVTALPSFTGLTPVANAPTANINFASSSGNFGASNRVSDVGAVFTGLISVPTSGLYTFYLESDDGSRLTLGSSQTVVVNDGVHAMTEVGGQVSLLAGLHTFKVEYFNGSAPGGLIARWQGPGIAKAVIPAANLFRLPVQCNAADVGGQGGAHAPDGVLDNNDFIVFIDYFFAHDARADLGSQGGIPGANGVWDNNDFVVFINVFFSPCN
jgi:predicted Zn-dependent protease